MDGNTSTSFKDIPHAALRVWSGNPRKTVGDVADLAASIRSVGLAEPLVVRALPAPEEYGHETGGAEGYVVDGHYTHEVIAGQRRYHAAALAGLTEVPCRVVALDDAAALELALVENSQRVDCDPLDEAESIDRLVRDHGRSPEEVASRLGRDPRWVRRRRSLLGLCDDAKAEVRSGRLPLGHAFALAAVDPTAQAGVLVRFTNRDFPSLKSFTREIFYALHLIGSAPFDTADDTLPGGACGGCPKRDDAQGQLDLFAGASPTEGAHCLDTMCWERKGDVTWDRAKASAKRRHLTVIEDSSEVLTPDYGARVFARMEKPYVVEAPSKDAKPVAITRTERGRIVELYVKPDAKPARDERDPDGRDADEVDDDGNPLEDDSDEEGDYPRGSPTAKRLQARVERFQKLIALVKTPAGLGVVARHALCVQIAEYGDVDLRDAAQAMGVTLPDEEDDQLAMAVPDEAAPILLALALAGGSLWEDTVKRSDNEGATERALRDAMERDPAPAADELVELVLRDTVSEFSDLDAFDNFALAWTWGTKRDEGMRTIVPRSLVSLVAGRAGDRLALDRKAASGPSHVLRFGSEVATPDGPRKVLGITPENGKEIRSLVLERAGGTMVGMVDRCYEVKNGVLVVTPDKGVHAVEKHGRWVEAEDVTGGPVEVVEEPPAAPSEPPQRVIVVSEAGDDWSGARKGLPAWSAQKTLGAGARSGGSARPLAMLHTPLVESADIAKLLSRYEKAGRKVLDLGVVDGDKVFDCDPSNRAVREQWNAAHPSARVEIAHEKKPAAKKAPKRKGDGGAAAAAPTTPLVRVECPADASLHPDTWAGEHDLSLFPEGLVRWEMDRDRADHEAPATAWTLVPRSLGEQIAERLAESGALAKVSDTDLADDEAMLLANGGGVSMGGETWRATAVAQDYTRLESAAGEVRNVATSDVRWIGGFCCVAPPPSKKPVAKSARAKKGDAK